MRGKFGAAHGKVIGFVVCGCLLAGPVLAQEEAAKKKDRTGIVQPASRGTEKNTSGSGLSLASRLSVIDLQDSLSSNFEAQRQVALLMEQHPRLIANEHTLNIEGAFFTSTLVSLAGLHAADCYLTIQALKYPQCQEANPLMRLFAKNDFVFAGVKLGMAYLSVRYLRFVHKNNPFLGWVASALANGILVYAVVNNLNVIQKLRRL